MWYMRIGVPGPKVCEWLASLVINSNYVYKEQLEVGVSYCISEKAKEIPQESMDYLDRK